MDNYKRFNNDTDTSILVNTLDSEGDSQNSKANKNKSNKLKNFEGIGSQAHNSITVADPTIMAPVMPDKNQRLRLRAVETELEYFLKVLNVSSIKKMLYVQIISSFAILVCQITLYAIVTTGYYKPIDATGIGIWGPLLVFAVATGLTFLAIRSPTGCMMGTAMGFQIASAIIGVILTMLACMSLVLHGRRNYYDDTYDPEVPGRVMCSFMILASIAFNLTCIFISVQFCRATCCGRYKATESVMFDVETVKSS